jgi:hypothetical protein
MGQCSLSGHACQANLSLSLVQPCSFVYLPLTFLKGSGQNKMFFAFQEQQHTLVLVLSSFRSEIVLGHIFGVYYLPISEQVLERCRCCQNPYTVREGVDNRCILCQCSPCTLPFSLRR